MEISLQDRVWGSLFGLAYGDALGAPFEFWSVNKIEEYFKTQELELITFTSGDFLFPKGFTTDDTAQMICLAESLLKKRFDLQDQLDRYRRWLFKGDGAATERSYGVGQHTFRVLISGMDIGQLDSDGKDGRAGGNGALMRSAPLALYFTKNLRTLQEKTIQSTYVTHNNRINAYTCAIFTTALSLLLDGIGKSELISSLRSKLPLLPEELKELIDVDYTRMTADDISPSGYAPITLQIALWGFLTSNDYLESIRKVIELGGDTDTFGAVTGAFSGTYYGFRHIKSQINEELVLDRRIRNISDRMLAIRGLY